MLIIKMFHTLTIMLYCIFKKHDIFILLNFSMHLHSDENFSGSSMSHATFLFNIFLYKNFQLEIVQPVLKAWFRPLIFKLDFLACQGSLSVLMPSNSQHITNIQTCYNIHKRPDLKHGKIAIHSNGLQSISTVCKQFCLFSLFAVALGIFMCFFFLFLPRRYLHTSYFKQENKQ